LVIKHGNSCPFRSNDCSFAISTERGADRPTGVPFDSALQLARLHIPQTEDSIILAAIFTTQEKMPIRTQRDSRYLVGRSLERSQVLARICIH